MERNIRLFYLFNFLTDFRPYSPIAILYFAEVTGSYALGMSVMSVVFVSQALFEIPTGVLSDHIGRRWTIVLGALSSSIGLVLYAVGGNLWFLMCGALFGGLSRSFYSGTTQALLFETLKETGRDDRFHEFLGKTDSMFQWALGLSAALGGLASLVSLEFVFWISVIPQFLGLLVSWFFTEPSHIVRPHEPYMNTIKAAAREFKNSLKLRQISYTQILSYGLLETIFEFQAAFFKTLIPVWAIGLVRTLNNFFAGASYWFSSKIIDRLGYARTLIGGTIFETFVYLVALVFPTPASPFVAATSSLIFGVGMTATNDLLNHEFTDKQRATMGSMVSFASSLCFAISGVVVGYIADVAGPISAMLFALSGNLVVIYFYFKFFGIKRLSV